MSTRISAKVWQDSSSSGTTLLVLLSLADQSNDDGVCWPSVPNLAQRCRISARTVQRALTELELIGEIVREERSGTSSKYHITIGTPDRLTPRQPDTPAKLTGVRGDKTTGVGGDKLSPRGDTGDGGGVTLLSPRNVSEPSRTVVAARKRRGSQLPTTWHANDKHRAYALANGLDLQHEVEQFKSRNLAKGTVFKDWDAAFRNWLGIAAKWQKEKQPAIIDDGRPEGW